MHFCFPVTPYLLGVLVHVAGLVSVSVVLNPKPETRNPKP